MSIPSARFSCWSAPRRERPIFLLLFLTLVTAHFCSILPTHPSQRAGAGRGLDLQFALSREREWLPDLDAISPDQDQLKLFVLGYPHNRPHGWEIKLLDQAMARGCRHQLVIANDNPYVDLALEEAPSLLRSPGWSDWGIEFFSLSKGWCLGDFAWRSPSVPNP